MNVRNRTTLAVAHTKRVADSLEQFVQAVALLTVASFSYYATRQLNLNEFVEIFVTGALVVIGLRGFIEFIKFLDK